jgi:CRP/FNR family transcriptional regulator, cyclic AMP receptor protein
MAVQVGEVAWRRRLTGYVRPSRLGEAVSATPRSSSTSSTDVDGELPVAVPETVRAPEPALDMEPAEHHSAGTIHLLDYLPDLAADIEGEEAGAVHRALRLPAIALSPGRCDMRAYEADPRVAGTPFGLVLIDGLLARQVTLAGRTSTSLYCPVELLDARSDPDSPLLMAGAITCPDEAIVAVLDDRVLATMRRWPHIIARLFALTMRQLERSDVRSAVGKLERVEDRLLAFFWLLAERFGRRGPNGVTIDQPLTHEAIGQLIGARRSTVSLGLRALYEQGVLSRLEDGTWLLAPESLQRVTGENSTDTDTGERPLEPV